MVHMRCIIMKFPLAYSIKNGLLGLCNRVSTIPCRIFSMEKNNNVVVKHIQSLESKNKQNFASIKIENAVAKKKFKCPSPHDLGIHHILKPFRPLIGPLVDSLAKVR